MNRMMNPAKKLRHIYGTRKAIAVAFNRTSEAVRLWERDGIPAAEALNVERATGGRISAYEILMYADAQKAAA